MRKIALLLAIVLLTGTASAQKGFERYEGNADGTGTGGTKVTANGIDYWTSGTPPRHFRVLGVLIDDRGTDMLSGNIIGSKSIAKRAKEVGGDAVILGETKTSIVGTETNLPMMGADGQLHDDGVSLIKKAHTRLVVIKYLER